MKTDKQNDLLDERCESCIFFGLCKAAKLPHCEGESYFEDRTNGESND